MTREQKTESEFINWLSKLFKKKITVIKGDLGVYHDVLTFNTLGNSARSFNYDIFVKVQAIEVYEDLIEVEILDVMISESVSVEMSNFIKHEKLKYLNPKDVKWQIHN